MNAKVSVIVICVEAIIIYLLLYTYHHFIFNNGLGKIFCNLRNSPIVLFTLVVLDFNVPKNLIGHQEINQIVFDIKFVRQ